jgi:hypothetical protein
VGVQIRVPASAVAVGERGGDQPGDVGLPNPVPALPGEQCLAFDEAQRILDRGPVRLLRLPTVRPMIAESMANMGRLLDEDY